GQDDEVADGGDPARHVVQLLALARRVHEEQDDRKRPALLGVDDEAVHRAVGAGDVEVAFDHEGSLRGVARRFDMNAAACASGCARSATLPRVASEARRSYTARTMSAAAPTPRSEASVE